jgi:hypothetical protein
VRKIFPPKIVISTLFFRHFHAQPLPLPPFPPLTSTPPCLLLVVEMPHKKFQGPHVASDGVEANKKKPRKAKERLENWTSTMWALDI